MLSSGNAKKMKNPKSREKYQLKEKLKEAVLITLTTRDPCRRAKMEIMCKSGKQPKEFRKLTLESIDDMLNDRVAHE